MSSLEPWLIITDYCLSFHCLWLIEPYIVRIELKMKMKMLYRHSLSVYLLRWPTSERQEKHIRHRVSFSFSFFSHFIDFALIFAVWVSLERSHSLLSNHQIFLLLFYVFAPIQSCEVTASCSVSCLFINATLSLVNRVVAFISFVLFIGFKNSHFCIWEAFPPSHNLE